MLIIAAMKKNETNLPCDCNTVRLQALGWIVGEVRHRKSDVLVFVVPRSETRLDGLVESLHGKTKCICLLEIKKGFFANNVFDPFLET